MHLREGQRDPFCDSGFDVLFKDAGDRRTRDVEGLGDLPQALSVLTVTHDGSMIDVQ